MANMIGPTTGWAMAAAASAAFAALGARAAAGAHTAEAFILSSLCGSGVHPAVGGPALFGHCVLCWGSLAAAAFAAIAMARAAQSGWAQRAAPTRA